MKALIKTVLVLALVGCVSLDPAFAQPPKAPEGDPSVADTIKQLVRDWTDAMIAADMDKLNTIMADDWVDGYPGKLVTKASFLGRIKSSKNKLETCEFGAMDVKVLGNVAVVQGTATEKIMMVDGKRSTVRVGFMDVFVKRGDKWVVVRSLAKKF